MTDTPSDFIVRDNPAQHRFEIDLGDGAQAIAEYRRSEDVITFTHTLVPREFEGKGVGSALARFALDTARARRLKVVPVCAFIAAYLKHHRDDQDLLTPASRDELGLG